MSAARLALLTALALAPAAVRAADVRHPTVVELYQSQGCSSCPPANANLNALASRPNVLALSFAVTYWDGLGWKDIFAQPAFTARQWDYARAMRHDQVWTPQVIVNGRATVVGNKRAPLEALIAANDRGSGGPALALSGNRLTVAGATARPADIWLVRYDPRSIAVPIKAGENNGRTLPHRNIVREMVKLGRWQGGTASFTLPPAKLPGLATAALVQVGPGGPIIAATSVPAGAAATAQGR
jgi:hypothetical protein